MCKILSQLFKLYFLKIAMATDMKIKISNFASPYSFEKRFISSFSFKKKSKTTFFKINTSVPFLIPALCLYVFVDFDIIKV